MTWRYLFLSQSEVASEGKSMTVEIPNWIRVNIRWWTITASDQADWPFHLRGKLGPVIRDEKRRGPQIYRFVFQGTPSPSCYVGESERFEIRARGYHRTLNTVRRVIPTPQMTRGSLDRAMRALNRDSKVRVAAAIQNAEIDGVKVELQLLDFPEFSFNNVGISRDSLSNPFHRNYVLCVLRPRRLPLTSYAWSVSGFASGSPQATKRLADPRWPLPCVARHLASDAGLHPCFSQGSPCTLFACGPCAPHRAKIARGDRVISNRKSC